ncbi:MAG TPA: hypothetical protein VEL47_06390 [Myxococcota bacterium]|nr:hypothetical protein [Myxococcota bacterium]
MKNLMALICLLCLIVSSAGRAKMSDDDWIQKFGEFVKQKVPGFCKAGGGLRGNQGALCSMAEGAVLALALCFDESGFAPRAVSNSKSIPSSKEAGSYCYQKLQPLYEQDITRVFKNAQEAVKEAKAYIRSVPPRFCAFIGSNLPITANECGSAVSRIGP